MANNSLRFLILRKVNKKTTLIIDLKIIVQRNLKIKFSDSANLPYVTICKLYISILHNVIVLLGLLVYM